VYKVFGIHPQYAKIIQMMLLAFSISVMPWIGRHYWSNLGILSGVVSAIIIMNNYLLPGKYCPLDPTKIMTEPLIVFGLSLWTVAFVFWEKNTTKTRTFLLGIASAVILLIKGVTIFVPFLFLLYAIVKFKKTSKTVELGLTFILGCSLLLIPWCIYASEKSGKIILLSKQFDELVLDGNNEDAINSGTWSPAWRQGKLGDYLYKRLESSGYPATVKVLIFLSENKKDVPKLLKNKLLAAFWGYKTIILLMLAYYIIALRNGFKIFCEPTRFPIFPLIYLLNIFLITVIIFGHCRFVTPFIIFFTLPATYLLLTLITQLGRRLLRALHAH
jgi:hypothetical protein